MLERLKRHPFAVEAHFRWSLVLLRLLAQPFVFDPVFLIGSTWRTPMRLAATALFAIYVVAHALVLVGVLS